MKKFTGIMALLFVLAVTFVPLSAKAEMKVMADNEMEMVTGQITIAQLLAGVMTSASSTLTCLGINPESFLSPVTSLVATISKWKIVKAIMPTLGVILNTEIPFTKKQS